MSPEQLVDGHCDERADVYSVGVLAYEMVTGHRPFADKSASNPILRFIDAPPNPSTLVADGAVSRLFDRLVLRGLEYEPNHRFATATELATAIDRIDSSLGGRSLANEGDEATWIGAAPPLAVAPTQVYRYPSPCDGDPRLVRAVT